MKTLKGSLLGLDIMVYQDESDELMLDKDASLNNIDTVLSQLQDGREKLISNGSRMLNKQERNYCITDRELLAL